MKYNIKYNVLVVLELVAVVVVWVVALVVLGYLISSVLLVAAA